MKWKPGLLIVCTNLQHVIQQKSNIEKQLCRAKTIGYRRWFITFWDAKRESQYSSCDGKWKTCQRRLLLCLKFCFLHFQFHKIKLYRRPRLNCHWLERLDSRRNFKKLEVKEIKFKRKSSLLWHIFHFPSQLVYCDFLLASPKVTFFQRLWLSNTQL